MILFATYISERLRYMVQTLLGEACAITDAVAVYQQHSGFHINYSDQLFDVDDCRIVPHGLLHESGIRTQTIKIANWQELPVFFQTNGHLPFDIFAAAFYLLSRYEEYLPFAPDALGRFPHNTSIASQNGFLQRPLINEWLLQWKQAFPALTLKQRQFQFQPTYDVDIAYAYKGKPFSIQILNLFKSLFSADWARSTAQWQVWNGNASDPFDQTEWLKQMHQEKWQPKYFILASRQRSKLDKQVNRIALAEYFSKLDATQVGIHPSVKAYHSKSILTEEYQFLSTAFNSTIQHSRQHYLMLSFPETYRSLIELGIIADYSMGYSTANGFRASYAMPFYWYDIANEQITSLQIFPFACMDTTCIFHLQLSAVATAKEYCHYLKAIYAVDGYYAIVTHPHYLCKTPLFEGYRQAYAKLLMEAAKIS